MRQIGHVGRSERCVKGKSEGKSHMEYIDADRRIIFKRILKKSVMRFVLDSFGSA
jgi:hypothetical protein